MKAELPEPFHCCLMNIFQVRPPPHSEPPTSKNRRGEPQPWLRRRPGLSLPLFPGLGLRVSSTVFRRIPPSEGKEGKREAPPQKVGLLRMSSPAGKATPFCPGNAYLMARWFVTLTGVTRGHPEGICGLRNSSIAMPSGRSSGGADGVFRSDLSTGSPPDGPVAPRSPQQKRDLASSSSGLCGSLPKMPERGGVTSEPRLACVFFKRSGG